MCFDIIVDSGHTNIFDVNRLTSHKCNWFSVFELILERQLTAISLKLAILSVNFIMSTSITCPFLRIADAIFTASAMLRSLFSANAQFARPKFCTIREHVSSSVLNVRAECSSNDCANKHVKRKKKKEAKRERNEQKLLAEKIIPNKYICDVCMDHEAAQGCKEKEATNRK